MVMRTDAFGLGTAALGARRAAVRLCIDAQGLRRAPLRVGTDAPFIPTDALPIRSAPFVRTDGCSTSSQRHRGRNMRSSAQRAGCPARSSGRSARSSRRSARNSGCSRDSRGCRAKARTRFAKSHGIIAHFSACPTHPAGDGASASGALPNARRRVTHTSGCPESRSRRRTSAAPCPRCSRDVRADASATSHRVRGAVRDRMRCPHAASLSQRQGADLSASRKTPAR